MDDELLFDLWRPGSQYGPDLIRVPFYIMSFLLQLDLAERWIVMPTGETPYVK